MTLECQWMSLFSGCRLNRTFLVILGRICPRKGHLKKPVPHETQWLTRGPESYHEWWLSGATFDGFDPYNDQFPCSKRTDPTQIC